MNTTVINPILIIKIYLANYLVSIPLLFMILYTGNWGRNYSGHDSISRWSFIALVFVFCILMPVWNGKWGFASMKAKIDSRGVTYTTSKDCFIVDWDKVQYIILYPDRYGRITKNCFICFVAAERPPLFNGYKDFNMEFIGIQWRKGLEETIREYTDKPIQGIEYLPGRRSEERR